MTRSNDARINAKRRARKREEDMKTAKPEPVFQHVKYGYCTNHGLGVCPADCKAVTINSPLIFERS